MKECAMRKLFDVINGNAQVIMYSDGTRIVVGLDDKPINLDTPLSLDIKLTNKCSNACPYCYEKSTQKGASGCNNYEFFNSLPAACEYNLGGGNIIEDFDLFLDTARKIRKAGGIVNTTVNLKDYIDNAELLWDIQNIELIHGLGVSYNRELFSSKDFDINKFKLYWGNNNIMHIINGLVNKEDLQLIKNAGVNKLLVLGMKNFGFGKTYYTSHGIEINDNSSQLLNWLKELNFEIVSYDNLAITQLKFKEKIDETTWNTFYQGKDGTASFYLDLVNGTYSCNSITPQVMRHKIGNLSIKQMFNVIKNETVEN